MIAVFGLSGYLVNGLWFSQGDIIDTADAEISSIEQVFHILDIDYEGVSEVYNLIRLSNTELMAALIKDHLKEEPEENLQTYQNGYVVYFDGNSMKGPAGMPSEFLSITYDTISRITERNYFLAETEAEICQVYFSQIKGRYYYLEPVAVSKVTTYVSNHLEFTAYFENIEEEYSNPFIVYSGSLSDDAVLGKSTLPIYTSEVLQNEKTTADAKTVADLKALNGTVSGSNYIMVREITHDNCLVVSFFPVNDLVLMLLKHSFVVFCFIITFSAIMIIWTTSVYRFVEKHNIPPELEEKYSPSGVRKYLLSFGALALFVIYFAGMFSQAVLRLQITSTENEKTLALLTSRLDSASYNKERLGNEHLITAEAFGERILDFMNRNPGLLTNDDLTRAAAAIESSRITIYDENGNQLLSSGPYIDLSIREEENETTPKLTELLQGIKVTASIEARDSVTTATGALVGMRIDQPDGSYGALIITGIRDGKGYMAASEAGQIMESLASSGSYVIEVDPETDTIVNSNMEYLAGRNAVEFGLMKESQKDDGGDFFILDNTQYFGVSKEKNSHIFYYAVPQKSMFSKIVPLSFFGMIEYLIIYIILFLILTYNYNQAEYERLRSLEEKLPLPAMNAYFSQASIRRENRRKTSLKSMLSWTERTPEQRAFFVFELLTSLILLMMFYQLGRVNRLTPDSSILNYLLYGNWTKGFNLFSFCMILLSCASLFGLDIMLSLFFHLIRNLTGIKGETICRLFSSITHYFTGLIMLYLVFSYLGVNTSTLNISATILTLTMTMGSQDLVTDLFAGIMIVFEGIFSVGDIIEVKGFRGTVLEIGVRSTKLMGRGGNIKSIPNRDVRNTLNLTRMLSWYTLELKLPNTVSLPEVENVLTRELPLIKERIPEIETIPTYNGLISMDGGILTVSITAECDEDNYFRVERKLNRELLLLFERTGIPLA